MLYLFHGSNSGKSRELFANFLKSRVEAQATFLSSDHLSIDDITTLIFSPPLLCERSLIAIEGYPSKALLSPLLGLLDPLPDYLDLVFWVGEKLKGSDELVLKSSKVGEVYVSNLEQEDSIFSFLDLVSQREKRKTQMALEALLNKGVDPYYIFSMLLWQFRNLLLVQLKCPSVNRLHPFVKKKVVHTLKTWDDLSLIKVHRKLLEYEWCFKTGSLSKEMFITGVVIDIIRE